MRKPPSPSRSNNALQPHHPHHHHHYHHGEKKSFGVVRTLLYLVGFGCFVHVVFVGPPTAPTQSSDNDDDSSSSSNTATRTTQNNQQVVDKLTQMLDDPLDDFADGIIDEYTTADDERGQTTDDDDAKLPSLHVTGGDPVIETDDPDKDGCPDLSKIYAETSKYKREFQTAFPVEVPKTPVDDWDAVQCTKIPKNCDLTNTTWGNPFIMVSFGRAGTTSTWDIVAGLTGEYIPSASEDCGRDKSEARAFFARQNQTEHGKCWLKRLLCNKQLSVKKAFKKGYGKASIFGTKWKPWHLGFNTTQAREVRYTQKRPAKAVCNYMEMRSH